MKLQENQAIAFVHRNRKHVHIHLYVDRIYFQGQAYKNYFIGKRSQQAAEQVFRFLNSAEDFQVGASGPARVARWLSMRSVQ